MKNHFCVMLDCSRNAVMKPEKVKEFALLLKKMGYNALMLYTEDTYEVEGEPYFGYCRGSYTVSEIRDIDDYCNSIGVELIPCIQALGHLENIFHWGEYKKIRDIGGILLCDEDRTYELIENIFKSLRKCYSSELINIGLDEAYMLGRGKYFDKNGNNSASEIFEKHLDRIIKTAEKYRFKPIMYSDTFFKSELGFYYPTVNKKVTVTPKLRSLSNKNVGLVYWDYDHDKSFVYDNMLKAHKEITQNVWFAGGTYSWVGFVPSTERAFRNLKCSMKSCVKNGVNNIIITCWGDNGKECSFYSVLPALFYARKIYEGETYLKKIKSEFARITGESFDRLVNIRKLNTVCGNGDSCRNVSKYAFYGDLFLPFIEPSMPEGGETEYAKLSKMFARYKQKGKYKYLFDCYSKLADVLSVKYRLGMKIREDYARHDIKRLKERVKQIKLCEKKTEKFLQSFSALWLEENKPQGFEVHEIRIGGLCRRLRSCRERLTRFIAGDERVIPELEQKLLPFMENHCEKEVEFTFLPSWSEMVTVNKI